jgi:hypothetical protein
MWSMWALECLGCGCLVFLLRSFFLVVRDRLKDNTRRLDDDSDWRAILDQDPELRAWWAEQEKLIQPDVKSDLDMKIREVQRGTSKEDRKEEDRGFNLFDPQGTIRYAQVHTEDVSGLWGDVPAERASKSEVRDVPRDHGCDCSPTAIRNNWVIVRWVHEGSCASRKYFRIYT